MKTGYQPVIFATAAELTAGTLNAMPGVRVVVVDASGAPTGEVREGQASGAPLVTATSASVASAVSAIAIADWGAGVAVIASEVRRAPLAAGTIEAGDLIRSNSARTTGATFDATEAGNWTEFTPDIVTSVAGRTGAVVLAKADVGLANVDNTTDAGKPVSTAQQTALDAKQATLVSGTSIKTVDGQSLVGAGNIASTILLVTAPIAIRITGAAGAGANYQTKLTIGESAGATGANFNLATAAGTFPASKNGSCSFLFWDSAGAVPFWVEKVTGTTPNRVAHVWVRPNIDLSSGTQTVFLTTAATNLARSAGDGVFTFFDDFDGAAVDAAKWDTTVLSGQTLASSVLSFGGSNVARRLLTFNSLGDGLEIMSLMRASDTNASTSNFGFVETNAAANTFSYRNVWDSNSAVMVGTVANALTTNINNGAGVLQVMRIGRAGGAGRFLSENPVNTFTAASGVPTAVTKSTIYNTYDNSTEIDWVAVKKFVATEPAFASAVQ